MLLIFIRNVCIKILSAVNVIVPKGNIAVFWSFPDVCDNAFAVFDYIIRHCEQPKKLVWLVKSKEMARFKTSHEPLYRQRRVKIVKKNALLGIYYFLRARYVFMTHGIYRNVYTPARQRTVHLAHGMPMKRIGFLDNKPLGEIPTFTYVAATSPLFQDIFARAWGGEEHQVLTLGSPRNDFMFQSGDVLSKLGISRLAYERVVLWMPTFRVSITGEIRTDGRTADSGLPLLSVSQMSALNDWLCSMQMICIIKPHPMDRMSKTTLGNLSHIRFIDQDTLSMAGVEIHSLLSEVDALITDYSSIFFDFLLLDRPIAFIHDDISVYNRDRGFLLEPIDQWTPGEKIQSYDDLIGFLSHLHEGVDLYQPQRAVVRSIVHSHLDGHSSERLVKFLGLEPLKAHPIATTPQSTISS